MSRRGSKRHEAAPTRVVQTPRGPASYVISGQTSTQWRAIEDAMRRCHSPDLRIIPHRPEARSVTTRDRGKPRTVGANKTVEGLHRDFSRDIRELSGLLAPWIAEPDTRQIHRLEKRIDRAVDAWEHLLGEEQRLRERQPLP